MNKIPSRPELGKLYGRRLSRGEYERITCLYVPHKTIVSSNSKGKEAYGTPRIQMRLHPECMKARRKAAK